MLKKILKIALWCFVVGVIVGLAVLYYVFNKPHRHVGTEKPAFTVLSDSIISEFKTNEQVSFNKYDDKAVEVFGVITEIVIEPSKVEVTLGEMGSCVSCSFDSAFVVSHSKIFANYKSGDSIYIQGKCDGYDDIMGVVLTRCVVSK